MDRVIKRLMCSWRWRSSLVGMNVQADQVYHFLHYRIRDLLMQRRFEPQRQKKYFRYVSCVKSQISLQECTIWSVSSLGSFWLPKDAKYLYVDVEDSDQTGCAGWLVSLLGACHKGHFLKLWLISEHVGVVGCGEDVMYLTSLGHPTDIGLQLGRACYPWGGMFLFLLFLHFYSCSSFIPVPLFYLLYYLLYLFAPFLLEMTQNDPQGLTCP